jgi:hypothetical protein
MCLPMILYNMIVVVVASVFVWASVEMLVRGTPIYSWKQRAFPSGSVSVNFVLSNSTCTGPFIATHKNRAPRRHSLLFFHLLGNVGFVLILRMAITMESNILWDVMTCKQGNPVSSWHPQLTLWSWWSGQYVSRAISIAISSSFNLTNTMPKALRYKPKGLAFETRLAALVLAVHSASSRNEYQKHKKKQCFGGVQRGLWVG